MASCKINISDVDIIYIISKYSEKVKVFTRNKQLSQQISKEKSGRDSIAFDFPFSKKQFLGKGSYFSDDSHEFVYAN